MNPKALARVEKVHSYAQLEQRESHNLRTKYTPNADASRADWNQEYVNLEAKPLRDLVAARIVEAQGELKPRAGQVLCMEVLLTASPEAFERNARGEVADMRESKWLKDTVSFARNQWGPNLVGCMLHQDEKTPHVQAFVVPINEKNRLSANTVFNPRTLTQLQTDFADAMADHKMVRGLRGSRAPHLTMQQMYARPQQTAAELSSLVSPTQAPPVTLGETTQMFVTAKFIEKLERTANEQVKDGYAKLNERLVQVGNIAVALSGEADRAQELQRRLEAEKKTGTDLRQSNGMYELQLLTKDSEIRSLREQLEKAQAALNDKQLAMTKERDILALQAVQQTLPAAVIQRGHALHEQALVKAREAMRKVDNHHFNTEAELGSRLNQQGYLPKAATLTQPERVVHNGYQDSFRWEELVPGCHTAAEVVQREREAQAAAQRRGDEVMKQVVQAKGFTTNAGFEQKAGAQGYDIAYSKSQDANQLYERKGQWLLRLPLVDGQPLEVAVARAIADTKQQLRQEAQLEVTQAAERALKLYFSKEKGFVLRLEEQGLGVTFPTPTTMQLRHRSGETFMDTEIKPNGQDLRSQYHQALASHQVQFQKENETGLQQGGISM